MSGPFLTRLIAATAFIAAAGATVLADWVDQRRAGPFELRSEFALTDDEGRSLVREMELLKTDVERLLAITATDDPIQVNLFAGVRTYREHLSQRVPEGMNRPALFVKGSDMSRVYVYRRRGYATDVRHECTHAVLHNALPFVPLWLDEGFAEYFETPAADRASGSPYLGSLKRSIVFRWKPNLQRLEVLEELRDMHDEEYRESWAWVHFMLHGPQNVRQVLSDYLYDIEQGDAGKPLSTRLAAVAPDYNQQLVRHLKTWR
ncbi:hypothetical protein AYO47_02155 [Planctomyces sp. SCGC AG-212-M04]|nr:hypothetical protein AYO47_02155 [Planctomyces sp. SCGC AG-212-M04]